MVGRFGLEADGGIGDGLGTDRQNKQASKHNIYVFISDSHYFRLSLSTVASIKGRYKILSLSLSLSLSGI